MANQSIVTLGPANATSAMRQHQRREGHDAIDYSAAPRIESAAEVTAQSAEGRAQEKRDQNRPRRHLQADPRAGDDTGQDVSADAVGAQPMSPARRLHPHGEIGHIQFMGERPGPPGRSDVEDEEQAADHGTAVAARERDDVRGDAR